MLEVEPGRTSVTLSIRLAITLLVGSTATCRNCLSCSLAKLRSACPKTLLLSRSVRLPSVISAKFRGRRSQAATRPFHRRCVARSVAPSLRRGVLQPLSARRSASKPLEFLALGTASLQVDG